MKIIYPPIGPLSRCARAFSLALIVSPLCLLQAAELSAHSSNQAQATQKVAKQTTTTQQDRKRQSQKQQEVFSTLNKRLHQHQGFTAHFHQRIIDASHKEIAQADGQLAVLKPNSFLWETKQPDQDLYVSDGTTIWHYSPFLEQVTIMLQEQLTAHTPFTMLTQHRQQDWQNYKISQQGDTFTLQPLQGDVKEQFQIQIKADGELIQFAIFAEDGQQSLFNFSQFTAQLPKKSQFHFVPPANVDIDDQRPIN